MSLVTVFYVLQASSKMGKQVSSKTLNAAGEIARLAMKRGLINCNGKTPDATMASALYTDLKRRDVNSIFIRPHEGLFGLREWAAEENGRFEVCTGLTPASFPAPAGKACKI